jgi:predicted transposase YdaD
MLVTSIREERKRLYESGFKDGSTQLREEREQLYKNARLEEKRNMAKTFLHKGTDISFIAEVTQLSEEEILKLKVKH